MGVLLLGALLSAGCAPPFVDVAAVYDTGRHEVVVVGSTSSGLGTWTWDGIHWSLVSSEMPANTAPGTSAFCFDRSNHSILSFGGWGSGVPINGDTWNWDAAKWNQVHPLHSPSPRFGAVLLCSNHPVLFGGFGGQLGPWLTDTWEWNGADWTQLHPAHGPGTSASFAVFDGRRDLIFLATNPSQTWTWTGTDWVRLA